MTSWKTRPSHFIYRLFLLKPTPVFKARLSVATPKYPSQFLEYTNISLGQYTDIKEGMTVYLGTSDGAYDLGCGRVRKTNTGLVATSDRIYVNQFSQGTRIGEFNLQNNAYITILDDYRVWFVAPRIKDDGTIFKDFALEYSHCEPQPPVANAGPGCAKILEPGSSTANISFDGSSSFAVASGASIQSYLWDFVDGTPSSANTSTVDDVVFPAGFRWVRLTVTDSNGKTHWSVTPVLVVDPEDPPEGWVEKFEVLDQTITIQGQTLALRVYDTIDSIPEGTLVLLWKDEYHDLVSYQTPVLTDRSHMEFIGWVDEEIQHFAGEKDGLSRTLELQCVDVAGRLKKLPGFPFTLERSSNANKWNQLKGLNIDRFIWYTLRWHSNVLSLADFQWSNTSDTYGVTVLGSEGNSIWDQAASRAEAIAHLLTCDRLGRIAVRPDPQLQNPANRTTENQLELTLDDISSVDFTYTKTPRSHWLWSGAIQASTADVGAEVKTLFSVAPGKAPGQGLQSDQFENQVVTNQSELNSREGHRYAVRANATYGAIEVVLAHSSDGGADPAKLSWVQINFGNSLDYLRQRLIGSIRFLLVEVRKLFDPDTGSRIVTLTLERESSGAPAQTYIPPKGEFEEWNDYYPGDYGGDTGYEIGEFLFSSGANSIAGITMNSYLIRTNNFLDDPPIWEAIFLNFVGFPLLFVVDAFSPGYVGTGNAINAWILTSQSIYKITDVFGSNPAISLLYSLGYTIENTGEDITLMVAGDASFGRKGHVVFVVPRSSSGYGASDVLWSVDGTNFSKTSISGGYTNAVLSKPNVYVSSKTPGLVYLVSITGTEGRYAKLFISTNYGATFQESTWDGPRHPKVNNLDISGSTGFHVPYHNNDDERDVYYAQHAFTFTKYFRKRNGMETDITPANEGRFCKTRWGFVSAPLNRDKIAFVPLETWNGKLYLSENGGNSWIQQTAVDSNITQAAIAGDNPDVVYGWGHNWDFVYGFRPRIWFSPDWGANWFDKRGNLESLLTSGNRSIIGICGGPTS